MNKGIEKLADILILAGLCQTGGALFAAEFEVLDRLSVDGYSVFRGSADIPGGTFAVGVSTFAVKNGKVGIGTTSSSGTLNIDDAAGTPSIYLGANNASNKTIFFNTLINSTAKTNSINSVNGALSINKAMPAAALADGALGLFANAGSLNSGNPFWQGWQFGAGDTITESGANRFPRASHFWSYSKLADPTDLTYNLVTGNSGTLPAAVNIQSSGSGNILLQGGNVGVGTTGPQNKLDVSGYLSFGSANTFVKTAGKGILLDVGLGANELEFLTAAAGSGYGFKFYGAGADGTLRLARRSNSASWMDILAFTDPGNVGIGTTAPGYKLEIGALSGSVEPTSLKIGGGATSGVQIRIGDSYSAAVGTLYSAADGFLASNAYQNTLSVNSWSKNAPTYASAIAVLGINPTLTNPAFQIKYSPANTASGAYASFFTTDLFTVLGNGNVGIGTSGPAAKLDVNGVIEGRSELQLSAGDPAAVARWRIVPSATDLSIGMLTTAGGGGGNNFVFNSDGAPQVSRLYGQRGGVNWFVLDNGTGKVGIGTTAPGYNLHVNGTAAGASGFTNLSDRRFKRDIRSIAGALGKIMSLRGVTFNWDKTLDPSLNVDDKNHIGFIAQDLEKILPQAVTTADDKMKTKSIAYGDVVPVLVEAIKEQQPEIERLKSDNAALKAEVSSLKERLSRLERIRTEKK